MPSEARSFQTKRLIRLLMTTSLSMLSDVASSWVVTSTIPWQAMKLICTLLVIVPLIILICLKKNIRNFDNKKSIARIFSTAFGAFKMWGGFIFLYFFRLVSDRTYPFLLQKIIPPNDCGSVLQSTARNGVRLLVSVDLSHGIQSGAGSLSRIVVHRVSLCAFLFTFDRFFISSLFSFKSNRAEFGRNVVGYANWSAGDPLACAGKVCSMTIWSFF